VSGEVDTTYYYHRGPAFLAGRALLPLQSGVAIPPGNNHIFFYSSRKLKTNISYISQSVVEKLLKKKNHLYLPSNAQAKSCDAC